MGTWSPGTSSRSEWKFWPERENVTLRVRTAIPGTYTDHALAALGGAAKRRAPGVSESAPSAGVVQAARLKWLLPGENLPSGVTPVIGDLIRDADDVDWTVLSTMRGKWGNTWHLETLSLALASGLTVTGTLTRPTNAQDAAHRQSLASYSTTVGTSACRVQPLDSQVAEILERRTIPRKYTAFLATPLAARAKDRFVADSVTYTVTGFKFPEQIDHLMELDLEAVL